MTKYYVFHCDNGFCGCDEDFYEEITEDQDLDKLAEDILFNDYSFAEPDGRFIDEDDDEDWEEDFEAYQNNLSVWYEEITKEEYEENN